MAKEEGWGAQQSDGWLSKRDGCLSKYRGMGGKGKGMSGHWVNRGKLSGFESRHPSNIISRRHNKGVANSI